MFYINYIKFKNDPIKTRQVSILVSCTSVAVFGFIVRKSIIAFVLGNNIAIYEYIYVLVLVYLLINVFISFVNNEDNEVLSEEQIPENGAEVAKEVNIIKKVVNGQILDEFIFNNKIDYNVKVSRGSLVPEFGDEGLEAPEDLEDEETLVKHHEQIDFIAKGETESDIKYVYDDELPVNTFSKDDENNNPDEVEGVNTDLDIESADVKNMSISERKNLLKNNMP